MSDSPASKPTDKRLTPLPQEVIRRKRDGLVLSEQEIAFFVRGLTDGSIGDGQAAAFAMAVFFRGMTAPELAALTREMAQSGLTLAWDLPGPVLDKHSTGGVGDKVSLILAPVIAACGAYVPMICGRGLGHTGGTFDKLESIPGYRTTPEPDCFRRTVREAGCAIIGQTAELAPADRRLYAVRDVTATVESIPLITASILSKKIAAGLQGLAMDVKFGSGAFMPDLADAAVLARSIVEVGKVAGLPVAALLTDMNEVLGCAAGNALEVAEAVRYLRGVAREQRLHEVVMALAGAMLVLGGVVADAGEGRARAEAALASGAAAERFARMVAALGGPADFLERAEAYLPAAPIQAAVESPRPGYVKAIDVRSLGLAVVALGGGRTHPGQAIDLSVGLDRVAPLGSELGPARPLAVIHARDAAQAEAAAATVGAAFQVGDAPPPQPVVRGHIDADGFLRALPG